MIRSRRARWAAIAAAAAMLAPACSFRQDREQPPPVPAEAQRGGTLTVGITAPGAIEPTFASSPAGLLVSSTLCDTLVHIDPATGEAKPGLAESWTVTDEGASITFKLRKELRFHGSQETLTAGDVVFSLQRLADPAEGSYLARLVRPIVGWEQFRAEEERATRLAGIQEIDRHSVQVRLSGGDADALRMFAHPATAPVPAAAVEANPVVFSRQPRCVGPYQLAGSVTPDATAVRLDRNPNYDAGAVAYTGGGAGYADEIVFRVFRTDSEVRRAWQQGRVDVAWLPAAQHAELTSNDRGDVVTGPSPHVDMIGLPGGAALESLPGFDQPAVRQALSLALDRASLADRAYNGARAAATGFVPTAVSSEYGCNSVPAQADVPAAQALLDEAGMDLSGRTVPLYFNDEFGHGGLVRRVAAQWRDAFGLRIAPEPMGWDELLDKAGQGSGMDGLFRVSWAADSLSAEDYLRPLVSDVVDGPNLARFAKPAADRVLFEIDTAEAGDRELAVDRLGQIICEELPTIPVLFGQSTWLVQSSRVAPAAGEVVDPSGRLLLRELYVTGG